MRELRILAISLAVASMLLAGCMGYPNPSDTLQPPVSNNASSVVLPNEPPKDVTWISPGKVNIGNFYPGARAEYPLSIHNGNDVATSFSVTYRYPDNVQEGYVKPLEEAQDWVIIADSTPVLMPKETKDILIVLAMPKDAKSPASKWEFWISVIDTTQKGMVRTELCARWCVQMR